MGKNSKKRRDARKKTKLLHSTLKQHQQHKKTLVPPLNKMAPIMKHTRWLDERMPELLWACLLRTTLPRDEVLDVFRRIALLEQDFIDSDVPVSETIPSHSNLAHRHPHLIADIVRAVTAKPLGYAALRPLLVVESLPGRQQWVDALGMEADPDEWNALADGVLEFFWHQSEQTTDVRWLIALWGLLSKKVRLAMSRSPRSWKSQNQQLKKSAHEFLQRSTRCQSTGSRRPRRRP